MASALERAAAEWLAALEHHDAATRAELARHYAAAQRSISAQLAHAVRRMEALEAAGGGVSYRYNRGRLEQLRAQIVGEVEKVTGQAAATISAGKRATAEEAVAWSRDFIHRTMREAGVDGSIAMDIAALRQRTVEAAVAYQSAGPLRTLLTEFGEEAGERVGAAITTGLATGASPLRVARRIAGDVIETYRGRAELIARTEAMRAVRQSTRLGFQADRDILNGWIWWSSTDRTTCAACWAMHGSRHTVDEILDGHPGCRCTMTPDVKAMAGMAAFDSGPTGPELFAQLDPAAQRAILGPGRFDLYQAGDISLPDMVARPDNARWGTMRRVATIDHAKARAAARRGGLPPDPPPRPRPAGDVTAEGKPPAPPKPKGETPSSWMTLDFDTAAKGAAGKLQGEILGSVQRAQEVLDDLLEIPTADLFHARRVTVTTGNIGRAEARYNINTKLIQMSPKGGPDYRLESMIHEFGHHLDALIAPTDGSEVLQTRLIKARRAKVKLEDVPEELREWWTAATDSSQIGFIREHPQIAADTKKYALSPEEIWARSFAQWAVLRGGTRAEYRRVVYEPETTDNVAQWTAEDFKPIAAAIDNLMRRRGWLRNA